ncbi:MAG: hypothetical protein QOI61_498 [Actinomycetota bacterium]|jgi:uncharacterized protein YjbJ (UPF0337 family)
MKLGTIDVNQLRGVTDKGVGLGKELVGTILGNDRLQQEGEAQQERAASELKALREQIKAQGQKAKAESFESKERLAQESKRGGSNDKLDFKDKSGVTETIKGKAKEAVGSITDNDALKREGEAQQQKGRADVNADKHEAKAKAHEVEAKEKELEQRTAAKS